VLLDHGADKRQIAAFGLWRPVGETTLLRGGYGIFYEGEYDGREFVPPFLLRQRAQRSR
jgi:hypothetical protein